MPLILTTPPSAEPLNLADAKAQLRVYHSDDDSFISTLIITARRLIEQRYDLSLLQQNWSLFLDDWPEGGIFSVSLQPLLSVTDIKTYGDDDTAATIDPAHYYMDVASNSRSRTLAQNIASEIELALDNAALSLSGHILVNLRVIFSNVTRSPSTSNYGASLRFRAATEPL